MLHINQAYLPDFNECAWQGVTKNAWLIDNDMRWDQIAITVYDQNVTDEISRSVQVSLQFL